MEIPANPRLLLVDRGFGRLRAPLSGFVTDMPQLPEPTDDLPLGLEILKTSILNFKPDILVACSRGGQYVAALVSEKFWTGPIVLVSAMSTGTIIVPGLPVVLAHGTQDVTIPIRAVRDDAENGTPGLVKLVEFDDNHHMACLEDAKIFSDLIKIAFDLRLEVERLTKQGSNAPPKKAPSMAAMLQELRNVKK